MHEDLSYYSAGKTAVSAKIVVLAYIERLATSPALADAALNSQLGLLMVRAQAC